MDPGLGTDTPGPGKAVFGIRSKGQLQMLMTKSNFKNLYTLRTKTFKKQHHPALWGGRIRNKPCLVRSNFNARE